MKISIITINLNNCNGLQKTIDSVVNQTFKDYEWIVIDGGSTDGSREMIEQYADRFSFWVSERDSGVYSAMNKGIKVSKGEYVLLMNSGDFFANSNVLLNVVDDLDCDIVAGWVKEDKTGRIIMPSVAFTPWTLFHTNIPHQAEFIKRTLFYDVSFYSEDMMVLSDLEFNIRCAIAGCKFKPINRQIAIVEQGGISNTATILMEKESRIIKNRNLPTGIVEDYLLWLDNENSMMNPVLKWAVEKKWPLKPLGLMYKLFRD